MMKLLLYIIIIILPYFSILEWGSWTACNDICGDQSIMKRERHRKCVDMCNRDKAEDKSKCTPINATMHNPPQVITTTETTDCVPCPVDRKYTQYTRSPPEEPHLAWVDVMSLLSLIHVQLGWYFNMLVSELAGVNWPEELTIYGHGPDLWPLKYWS